ncbi:MAG: acyl-CoA thioesterase [Oscillospiraceae bacterium]|nr:acyl-CoA thioesterase [Oscillospiraceae bacterium]
MKHISFLTVRGYELDSFGHVNNSVYAQYAETAMWECFAEYGLVDVMQEQGLFPVIMESHLRYMHELKLLEKVRIESEMKASSGLIRYQHHIYSDDTGKLACKVTGKIACVSRDRMINDIPEEIIRSLECDESCLKSESKTKT